MTGLLEEIYHKYHDGNTLSSVMFELTHRCICRCIHCYIDEREEDELTTHQVRDILHQFASEGAFNLGLTGGEVFLREDLAVILEEARDCGFFTFVLTTGILIDEAAADLLMRSNLHHVEISLMGSTAETHDMIMRHPGAFDKTIKAVGFLRERGIPVVLKSSILRQNVDELESMPALAASLDSFFNASLSILPGISGSHDQLGYAIDYDTAKGLNPAYMNGGFLPDEDMSGGAMLECNAGKTICGVSPTGDLYPCLIWRRQVGNLKNNSFNELWHVNPDEYLKKIRTSRPEQCLECSACKSARSCHRCPGMAFSEMGNFQKPVTSACLMAGKERGLNDVVQPTF
jgi:radical SAM protein with 4Fe4S-binding SPASM domain